MNQLRLLRILCMTILMGSTALAKVVDCPAVMGESEDGVNRKCCSKPAHKPRKSNCCGIVTPITKVPYVIKKTGKYCVPKNLVYTLGDKAIIVEAHGVTINFEGTDLELTNPSATGIYAKDVYELTITNDKIYNPTPARDGGSIAIHLVNVEKALIDGTFTENTSFGLKIEGSSDVEVRNSRFKDHKSNPEVAFITAGIHADNSSQITVLNSTFEGNVEPEVLTNDSRLGSASILLTGSNGNLVGCSIVDIIGCQFENIARGVSARRATNVVIKDCSFVRSEADTRFGNVELGSGLNDGDNDKVLNAQIIGCTFENRANKASVCAFLFAFRGNTLLIDDCTFVDTLPTDAYAANEQCVCINIGFAKDTVNSPADFTYFNDVVVRDSSCKCLVLGCIGIAATTGCVVDNFKCSGAVNPPTPPGPANVGCIRITPFAKDVVVKNSDVTNCGQHGIYFVPAFRGRRGIGSNIQVVNNTVTGCVGNGIYMDSVLDPVGGNSGWENVQIYGNKVLACAGDGIRVEGAPNSDVLVAQNYVFANTQVGINNLLPFAECRTAYNVSCNNGINCVGVFPVQGLGDSPAVAGSNVCCGAPIP